MRSATLFSALAAAFCLAAPQGLWAGDIETAAGTNVIRLSPHFVFKGALDIRLHPQAGKLMPCADFLLIYPDGRKIGNDIGGGVTYSDIAGAYYAYEGLDDDETGEPGSSSAVIYVNNPPDGEYTLRLYGLDDGSCSIEVIGYYADTEAYLVLLDKVSIIKGETREYHLTYSSTTKPAIQLKAK